MARNLCADCNGMIEARDLRCEECMVRHLSGLHADQAPATFPTVDEGMSLDLFRQRCAAMREERASRAWDIEIELPPAGDAPDEEMTQRPTAAQAEQRAREERRRLALAAGGGPRRRVDLG